MSDARIDRAVGDAIDKALAGKYSKQHAVGRGSYGEVWLVERIEDKKPFVAKVMAHEKKHRFDAEVQCLKSCNHFGIVGIEESVTSQQGPVMLLEFCDGGDLSHFIKDRAKKSPNDLLTEEFVGCVLVQLVMSIHHIHRLRMMHRDIKSANVLMCKNGLIKISDFGFSRQFKDTISMDIADTFLGTPYYLAPELWKRTKYSKKADVFSLGVVLYELMTLKRPFVAKNMNQLMDAVIHGNYEKPSETQYSPELRQLLADMLNVDPDKRPGTSMILMSPVVKGYLSAFLASVSNSSIFSAEEKALMEKTVTEQMEAIKTAPRDVSPSRSGGAGASPDDDDDDDKPVLEGELEIGSVKEWKPRYVVLEANALVVSRVKADKKKQRVELADVTKVSTPGPGAIQSEDPQQVAHLTDTVIILTLKTSYTIWLKLAANERDQWLKAIHEAHQTIKGAASQSTA